jgi:ribosomal RNA-processing protein 1
MATTDIQKTPFVRELASSGEFDPYFSNINHWWLKKILINLVADRKTRDKALESLTLFLKARKDLSLLELLKVWRGLFFCTRPPSFLYPSYQL